VRWVVLALFLSGCGLSTLGLLGGSGGPTVNSNAQIGKENRQSVLSVENKTSAGRDVVTKEVETGKVENLDIINTNIPPWVILVLILGWILPTPTQMAKAIYRFITAPFRRKTLKDRMNGYN
jgi:hypothetical protein